MAYAGKVACSEDLKLTGEPASFNQQTSQNIGLDKNQAIDIVQGTGPWCQSYSIGHVMRTCIWWEWNDWMNCKNWTSIMSMYHTFDTHCSLGELSRVSFCVFKLFLVMPGFWKSPLLQPIPYSVCIIWQFVHVLFCNFPVWNFSAWETSFSLSLHLTHFAFFVLYQRDERQEGVISLKSTNFKAAYSWVVAKSPNNVMVNLQKDKSVEF